MIEYIWKDSTDNYQDRKELIEKRFEECAEVFINNLK